MEKYNLYIVIFIAVVARLIQIAQLSTFPLTYYPTVDALFHKLWAEQILHGNFLGNGAFFRAPLYPYFLAAIFKILGTNLLIPRIIQHIIGIGTVLLTYRLADRAFGKQMAFWAGITAAIYPTLIYFESRLLLDSLAVLLDLLLLNILVDAFEKDSLPGYLLSGIILGTSALTRPNILLFSPFILLWFLLARKRELKKNILRIIPVALGAILIVSPVTLRNYIKSGDFVLIATQGGVNFYIGNNQFSDGATASVPEFGERWEYRDCIALAEETTGEKLSPSDVSEFFYKKGICFITNHPKEATLLFLRKIYLWLNRYEVSNNQNIYFHRRYFCILYLLPFAFTIVGTFGLFGMSRGARKNSTTSLLTIYFITYSISIILFFVTARFRLPVLPVLIIFTPFGLTRILSDIKNRRIPYIILFIVIAFIVNSNLTGTRENDFSSSHFSLGNVYLRKGELDSAKVEFKTALKLNPNTPGANLNLGVICFHEGRREDAKRYFLRETEVAPKDPKAYSNLCLLYRLEGNLEEAERFCNESVRLRPAFWEGYYNLAKCYIQAGDYQKADSIVSKAISRFGNNRRFFYLAGVIAEGKGKLKEAHKHYLTCATLPRQGVEAEYNLGTIFEEEVGSALSENDIIGICYFNLGTLLGKQGQLDSAAIALASALSWKPDLYSCFFQLGVVYDAMGDYPTALKMYDLFEKYEGTNVKLFLNRGLVYAKMGKLTQAEKELLEAKRRNLPEADRYLEIISRLKQN
ncbi:tetratricopeptide repeat protein [bacterium]|nr:tetratricopeptide repeat protein [bacterium]